VVVVVLYAFVGTATVLVLRSMTGRWRREDHGAGDVDVPYGPSADPVGPKS
jgi:hypothetical protein